RQFSGQAGNPRGHSDAALRAARRDGRARGLPRLGTVELHHRPEHPHRRRDDALPLMTAMVKGAAAQDPVDVLRFYAEAGVDLAASEAQVDRFAWSHGPAAEVAETRRAAPVAPSPPIQMREPAPAARSAPLSRPAPPPARQTPNLAVPSEAAVMAAREA